ncbi:MAG: LpqB family beta-propeller domain-containing protein, partial [Armatimonadota bacterium]|nr:LpqB family beta-propeller domain-containing protein [Armatimonadota bacterium]
NAVYAGTRSEGDSAPTGVLRSIDGGEHWTVPANNGLPAVTISALVASADTVYAATGRGLFKTTDTGENWTEADTGIGAGAGPVVALTMLPDGTLFAGTRDGIFKSADKGATWTAVNTGLKSTHAEFLAVSPDGATLYANSGPNIYRSADKGTTWEFRSQAPNDSSGPLQIAPGAGTTVYIADRQTGVWSSADGGGTWTPLSAGLGTPQVLSLALSSSGRLYAGTSGASVWQTTVKAP